MQNPGSNATNESNNYDGPNLSLTLTKIINFGGNVNSLEHVVILIEGSGNAIDIVNPIATVINKDKENCNCNSINIVEVDTNDEAQVRVPMISVNDFLGSKILVEKNYL